METHDIEFVVVENLDNNDRGGGFGSTDKPVQKYEPPQQRSTEFSLKGATTVQKFLADNKGSVAAGTRMEMVEAHLANYQGELYTYEQNGFKGICVVDSSGTTLVKLPLLKL